MSLGESAGGELRRKFFDSGAGGTSEKRGVGPMRYHERENQKEINSSSKVRQQSGWEHGDVLERRKGEAPKVSTKKRGKRAREMRPKLRMAKKAGWGTRRDEGSRKKSENRWTEERSAPRHQKSGGGVVK